MQDVFDGSTGYLFIFFNQGPLPQNAGHILHVAPINTEHVLLLCVTWSGESFPSSATILLRQATEPNRGTDSPTLRYLCPLVLNTRITHSGLPQVTKHNQG